MQNNDHIIGPRTTALIETLKAEGFSTVLTPVHDELHIELKRIDGVNHFNIERYNEIHQQILTAVTLDLQETADAIRASWRERHPAISRFWGMCQGRKNDGE